MNKEMKHKFGAVLIIALMCIMAMGAVFITVPENAQAAYWYSVYEHRQEYTVTNAELTAVTNVTIDIYLTEANNPDIFDECLSTGYDIVFTDRASTTRYEHYMAYWDYADHDALFQVLIPSIAASTTLYFWIYYGYSAATDLSDGDAVFGLFDDFSYATPRNVTTDGFSGNSGGAIWEKYPTSTYTPDIDVFNTSYVKMRGLTNAYNQTEGQIVAYGSYMNASYNCILGMNNTDGYGTDWTDFANVLVNHSTTATDPDFIKASEPDFLHLISDSWHRSVVAEHGADLNMSMFYTGLNATNYSINLATSPIFDATWTKNPWNPVLTNGTLPLSFDNGGVRKPVTWKDGEEDYRMIYSGYNATSAEWKLGYATAGANQSDWTKAYTWSVFNGSEYGWDNGTDINALDIYHDGSKYVLLYSANDWQGVYRQGVATTLDFVTWTRVGGYLGIGDSTDWDGYNATYATWMSDDNARWAVYYTGQNSTGNVSMGYADVRNSTITDWSSWQRDCGGDSMAFVNAENQLEVQWNTTMLERAVDLGNYSVTVDIWATGTGTHNESLFMRSDGGAYGTSEDYYALAVNSGTNLMDTIEWTGGASALLEYSTFYYNGTAQQMLKMRAYGGTIYTYAEGMDTNNTASNSTYDTTIESGEIGIRVDTQPKVKFDNFRTLTASNGTLTIGAGTAYDWVAESFPGGGGGDVDIPDLVDDTLEVGEDWDEVFTDWCGLYWWMVGIGMFIFILGAIGSSLLAGILTREKALIVGAIIMLIGYSLKTGEANWLVIIGAAMIVIDMIFQVPLPYLKKPMATILGAILILLGIMYFM